MLWIVLSLLGALFTSLNVILAKIGIKDVKSNLATFYRTGIVIICLVIICIISGSIYKFSLLTKNNYIFLILSGIATGCSWLCYYKALKIGDINKVAPIDKASFVLTSILFIIFFFDTTTNNGDILTIAMLVLAMILMLFGTILMIGRQEVKNEVSKTWLIYSILSAIFASIVALFVKIGLKGIPSDLGTFLRTIIVFLFAFAIVIKKGEIKEIKKINKKTIVFLTLSGIATGGAWLCEYSALNILNVNPVAVSSINKLSILLTMLLSYLILKEKFTKKSLIGLSLLTLGIVIIITFSL